MNFVDVSVFYDEAASRISGAPLAALRMQLKATLREFYLRSGAFVIKASPQNIVAGQAEYSLDAQAEGAVLTTLSVLVNDKAVRFSGSTSGPGIIVLNSTPAVDITNGLSGYVSLRPFDYDTIPEETYNFDFDTILDGLSGRMFAMPDRPWTNKPEAAHYLRMFRQGQSQARVRVASTYTQAAAGWKFPAWA